MEHIQSRPDARLRFAAAALAVLLIAMVAASGVQELALKPRRSCRFPPSIKRRFMNPAS